MPGEATLYAANTAGAITGAARSFVLIPRIGLQASIQNSVGRRDCRRTHRRVAFVAERGSHSSRRDTAAAATAMDLRCTVEPRDGWRTAVSVRAIAGRGDVATGLKRDTFVLPRRCCGTVPSGNSLASRHLRSTARSLPQTAANDHAEMLAHCRCSSRRSTERLHHRSWQRGHAGIRAESLNRARHSLGNLARGGLRIRSVREGKPSGVARSTHAPHRRRRAFAPAALRRQIRRDHFRAVEPVDGGGLDAVTRESSCLRGGRIQPGGTCAVGNTTTSATKTPVDCRHFLSTLPDGSAWLVGEGDMLLMWSDGADERARGRRDTWLAAPGCRGGPGRCRCSRSVQRADAVCRPWPRPGAVLRTCDDPIGRCPFARVFGAARDLRTVRAWQCRSASRGRGARGAAARCPARPRDGDRARMATPRA